MSDLATISLPCPPSLNSSYANIPGRGRIATKKLKSWKVEAGWQLQLQKPRKFDGPVIVEVAIQRTPRERCADIDNRLKACLDLLVSHGVIKDDRLVVSVKGTWIAQGTGKACTVTVSKAAA